MNPVEIILYVQDQKRSRDFYTALLEISPRLDVPGMTELQLNDHCILGLMPESGISRILCDTVPAPASGNGIPRCELYLIHNDPAYMLQKAIGLGALMISPAATRDWGHTVAYVADPDGHIIAFAKVDP
jgi:catechol 2,3-dioxygenase-like lactoylglutathione lyase family enzyme